MGLMGRILLTMRVVELALPHRYRGPLQFHQGNSEAEADGIQTCLLSKKRESQHHIKEKMKNSSSYSGTVFCSISWNL